MSDETDYLVFLALVVLCWALVSQCADAQSVTELDRPMTARDMALNEARAVALSEPHDAVHCFQERQHGRTHVCITETEWMRQHEDDNGEKTQAPLPAVAGAD